MRRVRFTVRRMMLVVAVVGVILATASGIRRREQAFWRKADYHRKRYWEWEGKSKVPQWFMHGIDEGVLANMLAKESPTGRHAYYMAKYHGLLISKYMDAARSPWLPVAPDPPEPE